MHYADKNDAEVEARIKYILTELSMIQSVNSKDANFVGYISGVPNGKAMWLKMKNGDARAQNGYWVPWYNIHKLYADRKSTRLNSSHVRISYAVFCLKKKKKKKNYIY